MPKIANKKETKKRGNPAWVKGGASPNPVGRPATGQSWAELIKKIGDMSPKAAAEYCKSIAGELAPIGDAVTLKEAVVLRVYTSLLFEPQPGLFNAFMERTEGKVAQPVTMEPSHALLSKLQELGLTLNDVRSDPLAAELFRLAGVAIDAGNEAAGTTGSEENA